MNRSLACLLIAALVLAVPLTAQTATTTVLSSSPNPSAFGAAVTLSAAVSPAAATGKVTFYDGVSIIGVATLASGSATLATVLLPSGAQSLRAYYGGNGVYASSSSAIVSQTVNAAPQVGFQTPASYLSGSLSYNTVAIADFNGDGHPDIAAVTSTTGTMTILLGKGDGTFTTGSTYDASAGSYPVAIASGDFNGDGVTDLVVAGFGEGGDISAVYLYLGNGNGTFQKPTAITDYETALGSITVGDFNNDGFADMAAGGNSLTVFLGNGSGAFSMQLGGPAYAYSAALGDFNRDGIADFALGTEGNGFVGIALGNGNGTFQSPVHYTLNSATSVAIGDFNADGFEDVAIGGNSAVYVMLGNGDGTFQAPALVSTLSQPLSVAVADFNGDGHPDICTATYGNQQLNVLLSNGDGTFSAPLTYTVSVSDSPDNLAVGDFRGNGTADIVVGGQNGISVLLGVPGVPPVGLTPTAGTPQSTQVTKTFPVNLQVRVTDATGAPVAGIPVTFTAPQASPTGFFAGNSHSATATTDASGMATAPTLRADRSVGVFTVRATIPGAPHAAKFHMTNKL